MVPERKEVLLSLENLSLKLSHPSLGTNLILRDINDVKIRNIIGRGQSVAILGSSGVGKTQLSRLIAGLQKPTSGQVLLGAEQTPAKAGQLGVVAQNYYVDARLVVIDAMMRAGRRAGLTKLEAKDKAERLLNRFGIFGRKYYYPDQLSGGQRQRLAIAEQMMCSEYFLLMDEPFSGLDHNSKQRAHELINKEVVNAGELNTAIIITHGIEDALKVADTVWFMGRDRDAEGKFIPGGRIIEILDLAERGLAWQSDIHRKPEFRDLVGEIEARFLDPKGPYSD